jgi:two-component system cell cycle response regulator
MSERKPRILVVDDEPDILTILRVILQSADYEVQVADDGMEAVRAVYGESPDLVILDVMMPRMNGYQVCRLLKHDHRTRHIPIVLCTVKALETDRLYGMSSGADYYLTKPFDPSDLLKTVREALQRHQRPSAAPHRLTEAATTDAILTEVNRILDQKLHEYTLLQHVSRAIAGTLNLDDILSIILKSTTTDLGFRRGMFLLIEHDGRIEERCFIGSGDTVLWNGHLGEYPLLEALLRQGRPRNLADVTLEEVFPPPLARFIGSSPRSALVPVMAKNILLGAILVCEGQEGDQPSPDTLEFLTTVAGQAALAVENARLYTKTLQLSITDGLTGLYNYRYFMERLDAEFVRARRYHRTLVLLILDIDHFKLFNDRYGHLKGDEILRRLAEIIRNSVREVDVPARYGGEEFAIIMPETEFEDALSSARRLRQAIAGSCWDEGRLTVSIGVTGLSGDITTYEELIRRADEALYDAKRQGRDRICSRT